MVREKVLHTIRHHKALADVRKVVVAVSGGCDSVSLLHLLVTLREEIGLDLHVASLDHGLREDEGRSDLDFVGALAKKWRLPCTLGAASVSEVSRERGVGIEEAARLARYEFLADVARKQAATCVAVGHHANDQAETILMHIVRGSGVRGLRGMPVVSHVPGNPDLRLLRPLLAVTRKQLQQYCAENDLSYRCDHSNVDTSYARNFLRHEVFTRLQRLNPQLLDAFARLAESAATDLDFLERQFAAQVLPRTKQAHDNWRIAKDDFARLHPALQRRFLREASERISEGSLSLTYDVTVATTEWMLSAQTGRRRQLGAGLEVRISYDNVYVALEEAAIESDVYRLLPAGADICLDLTEGFAQFGMSIRCSAGHVLADTAVRLVLPASVALRLRTRRLGDRFKPRGMGGRSRKVKDWMIDRKIPRELRDRIPLLTADGEIVAICLGDTWRLADLSRYENVAAQSLTLHLG